MRYFGIVPMAQLSGAIFQDHNGNGVQDGGEPGLSGETVILSGPTPDTAVSGVDGAYSFGGLAIGSYALSVATASGWIVTTQPPGRG